MSRTLISPFGMPIELKAVSDDGVFEGYASLFNREDLGNDVILPGAFADSLERRSAAGIKLLFQHDPAQPIGVWDNIHEDARGLHVRGRLLASVARAREVLSLMKAGALDGLSIGFKTLAARRDARSGTRRISKIDLWEISIVTFPMLPDARVKRIASNRRLLASASAKEFEAWLTADGTLTVAEARALLAGGLANLHAHANRHHSLREKLRAATERLQS